jgi:hypothetical protein
MALVASTPAFAQDDDKNASQSMEVVVDQDTKEKIVLHLQRN